MVAAEEIQSRFANGLHVFIYAHSLEWKQKESERERFIREGTAIWVIMLIYLSTDEWN
jgi:superfamily II DNA helicase RecQ